MEDGYRVIKRVAIVIIGMALLNLGLHLLAQAAAGGAILSTVFALGCAVYLLQGSNVARWIVVVTAGLGALLGLYQFTQVGDQIGYFHWLSLWVLSFALVKGAIVGVLTFNQSVNEFFGT